MKGEIPFSGFGMVMGDKIKGGELKLVFILGQKVSSQG